MDPANLAPCPSASSSSACPLPPAKARPRAPGAGVRRGPGRRRPGGVPKEEFARRDYYDVWLPNLSPSAELMAEGRAVQDDKEWAAFSRKYLAEMKQPDASHLLDTLAALSHQTAMAVGCYCEDERR